MDELVQEFLVEAKDGLEILDNDLVTLEKNPNDRQIVDNIFRAMHTLKGTCGFLGLGRLEAVAHAGENILDKIRAGEISVAPAVVSIVLESVDQIKYLVEYLEEHEKEPEGKDTALIARLNAFAEGKGAEAPAAVKPAAEVKLVEAPKPPVEEKPAIKPLDKSSALPPQDNDDLQKLFDATPALVDIQPNAKATAAPAVSSPASADTDDLQKLFDTTPSLVASKPEAADAKKPAKVEPVAHHDDHHGGKKDTKDAAQSIRVNLEVLEQLMQQASELVLTRNQLLQILRNQQNTEFTSALHQLNHITTGIQEGVMKTRMQPVGSVWAKLPRLVRDLAGELHKKIELQMEGEDTELDRQLLDWIKDPLTHMVRNSADHGLEGPEDRKKAGKPETGIINLKAYQGGGYIIIEISDDGRGIDPVVIRAKAIEKGLVSESDAQNMSNSQILQFIFAAGFSTAKQITSVSGRGVGMDVVKNNIEKISGTVDLRSVPGKGSTFTIKIPLTLAIMPVLEVVTAGQTFAIPQINVTEIIKAGARTGYAIEHLNARPVIRLRGKLLPLIVLRDVLRLNAEGPAISEIRDLEYIVVCELGGARFGVIVEGVNDTEEIVVKPVAPILKHVELYSGCTILGNGNVIMILDPNGLAKAAGEANTSGQSTAVDKQGANHENEQMASFVMFKAGDATPKVVPLELLSRLEEVEVEKIEISKGKPVIQYRGGWMQIAKIDPNYQLPTQGMQEFLVFIDGDKTLGIAVEEIIDIVRCPVTDKFSSDREGYLGSLVIDGKTCDVIDSSYYFAKVFKGMEGKGSASARSPIKRVLLVDDSPFFRRFIPPELKSAGYDVVVASDGKEALAVLEQEGDISAVVTDMNMPGMSGQDLVKACRADNRFKHIPIIALSSHNRNSNSVGNIVEQGFSGFVSKTQHNELVAMLASVLSSRNSKEAA